MKHFSKKIEQKDIPIIKKKLTLWGQTFNPCIVLDSNDQNPNKFSQYELLLAVDPWAKLVLDADFISDNKEAQIRFFFDTQGDWCFGFVSYGLKNITHGLTDKFSDPIGFPKLGFFKPNIVITIKEQLLTIHSKNKEPNLIYQDVLSLEVPNIVPLKNVKVESQITKYDYLIQVNKIKSAIQLGDFYELNYCQSFIAQNSKNNLPIDLFFHLNDTDKGPFSALVNWDDKHLICASPERFIVKKEHQLSAQPIKGTIKRGQNEYEDRFNYKILSESKKDRAENIMIVDLVRNDLSKIAKNGSVKVTELCQIYPFEKVFQMISTVEATLEENYSFWDILLALFPMGSMTGAPKHTVMEHINEYEASNRGLYSGSVGYIAPDGDFDFNVVIRSIQLNSNTNYLSFHAGGAIVDLSDPTSEYEECLLKVKSIHDMLS